MSRLGDLIRTERIRQKMTPKQVAKKCGVSESFILAVEAGTRIIADDQARRILKTIGLREQTEADFTLDDIAATVDLQTVQPAMVKKPAAPKVEKVALHRRNPCRGRSRFRVAGRAVQRTQACTRAQRGDEARGSPPAAHSQWAHRGRKSRKGLLLPGPGRQHARFPHSQRGRGPGGARTKPHRWRGHAGGIRRSPAPCARSKSWTASKCSCNPMTGSTTRKPWRSPT